jgi:hypothetical protein
MNSAPPTSTPTYSRELIQSLFDQSAFFNLLAVPDKTAPQPGIRGRGGYEIIGLQLCDYLHRLNVITIPPTEDHPIVPANAVGESIGSLHHRLMLAPDDFVGLPGLEPPPTPLDPSRTQRFILLDGSCTFGKRDDGFSSFGAGFTVPSWQSSQHGVDAVAVCTVLEGRGRLSGHNTGMYILAGSITPDYGFTGNILLRILDPQEVILTSYISSSLQPETNPDPDVTYFLIRGQAREEQVVKPLTGPDGSFQGLQISQDLRICSVDSDFEAGRKGLQTTIRVGQIMGIINTTVVVNPADPRGTPLAPLPGRVYGEYLFYDACGRTAAGFKVDFTESRSFRLPFADAPGLQSLLAGNIGRIYDGTGFFAGLDGLASDNLLVSFNPHVSSGLYVFRVNDPQGKLRALAGNC